MNNKLLQFLGYKLRPRREMLQASVELCWKTQDISRLERIPCGDCVGKEIA